MNKKHTITQTFALLLCLVAGSLLYGQCPDPQSPSQSDCDNGKGISTNPDSPVNEECEDMENGFDWKLQSTSSNPEYYTIQKSSTETQEVWNPFKGPFDASYYGWVTGGLGHLANNYYPEDGWELLKFDNGYLADNTTQRTTAKSMIYLCYYNKHRELMRFFGMVPVYIRLSIRTGKQNPLC